MIEQKRPKKPAITVFGAGIAGLTVAHELVTRGFPVQVIDPDYNEEYDENTLDRGIGGMARSQWAVNLAEPLGVNKLNLTRLWAGPTLLNDLKIPFTAAGVPVDEPRADILIDRLIAAYDLLDAHQEPVNILSIVIPTPEPPADIAHDRRVKYLKAKLKAKGFTNARLAKLSFLNSQGPANIVWFFTGGETVPAEHGFRFFPSFYRHLFDTMRRTPIVSPTDAQRTKATTFDNLVATDGLGFARADHKVSFMVPRHEMSLEETRVILCKVLEQLGYTGEDIARFSLKIFKYMTSSSPRRADQYENLSWGDFLEAELYSPISRKHIENGPQMSAALKGSESDTRTQGNITIQLMMDQLKPTSLADYTLSGPTSSYWLNHWHDFLRSQGVQFVRGKLLGFEGIKPLHGPKGSIVPVVEPHVRLTGTKYVLALSLPAMAPLAPSFLAAAEKAKITEHLRDMTAVSEFAGDLTSLAQAHPDGPLQHLSGIQYYFDQDLRFWRGHTQYLDSEWGLTSICQPQFWSKVRSASDGYRSILSVDLGAFDRKYQPKDGGKAVMAWECSAEEIAHYAWEQIIEHHLTAFQKQYGKDAKIPVPIAFSIDSQLTFEKPSRQGHESIVENKSPFLVNKIGAYEGRPGLLIPKKGTSKSISYYDVIDETYVMCGTFMKTYTRLTSMEGANESARHAVNALLQVFQVPGDKCEIWDPEDNEVDDLEWLKDLDEELHARGLPHFVDVLGWDALPRYLDTSQLSRFAGMVRDRKGTTR
ncbi:MAG: hypothetical protein ABI678_14905 [Kofleriaceae bacterium]